jgi:hypothetical protein
VRRIRMRRTRMRFPYGTGLCDSAGGARIRRTDQDGVLHLLPLAAAPILRPFVFARHRAREIGNANLRTVWNDSHTLLFDVTKYNQTLITDYVFFRFLSLFSIDGVASDDPIGNSARTAACSASRGYASS